MPETPEKNIYVTRTGLPLSIRFEWPFRKSTSCADFWVLHADIQLENSPALHAPVAVNLSATVREIMPSLEEKDAEAPVINALRKEIDRRQLEFMKSGKLVPVHFSSRHYDFKRNRWVFGKADDQEIARAIQRKVFWQSKIVGGNVWLADPAEALYLETTPEHVLEMAGPMAKSGLFTLEKGYARANQALMADSEKFETEMQNALAELERKHAFERGSSPLLSFHRINQLEQLTPIHDFDEGLALRLVADDVDRRSVFDSYLYS